MAMPPASPAPTMPDPTAPPTDDDEDAGAPADTGDDTPGDEDVLLTVCKEADGTYSLIKGDEEDADGADAAGSADAGAGADSNKQTFDSIGALLKGILDLLKEDASSAGADGSADSQFQSGFDDSAPAKPASPMVQKY